MEDDIREEKIILNHEENITYSRFYKNNILYREEWLQNGLARYDQDLPAYIYYYENGNKEKEIWYRHEEKEEGGTVLPDTIYYYENGTIKCVHINIDDNGADLVVKGYYENGNKKFESWRNFDQLHREGDLPAVINYYENGNKERESWFMHGYEWRDDDKPSDIKYYENGNIKQEKWIDCMSIDRENNLPAFIKYDENGNKKHEEWWVDDVFIRSVDY